MYCQRCWRCSCWYGSRAHIQPRHPVIRHVSHIPHDCAHRFLSPLDPTGRISACPHSSSWLVVRCVAAARIIDPVSRSPATTSLDVVVPLGCTCVCASELWRGGKQC